MGKRIRELRKGQGLSQDQLAYEVGIRREQVIRIEAGTQSTGIDILKNLAEAFGLQLAELFKFDY